MYEIDKVKFGAFISELRKEKGITQKELAGQLYISDKAISKWETGHSVPDITLLAPLAEILGVTVTELLECHRIENTTELNVEQTDDLVKKVISLSEEEKISSPEVKKRRLCIYLACALISLIEIFIIHQIEHMWYFEMYTCLIAGMCMLFGIYFWFFMKEKLPAYYDENKINVYIDGIFHMNMPGVYFNNKNWPYITKALRIWSALGMTVFPPVFILLSSWFEKFRPTSDIIIMLALILGGLFIPIYMLGSRHMYTSTMLKMENEKWTKKLLTVVVILGLFFCVLMANGNVSASIAMRVGSIEHATKTEWTIEYMFCDGFMQRTMKTAEGETDIDVVVESEEGVLGITIIDKDGNVIFDEKNIQTGNYKVAVTGKYAVRAEMEDHKGGFHIGE